MLRAAACRAPAWPLSAARHKRIWLVAPGSRRARSLAARDGTPAGGGADDLPRPPTPPDLDGLDFTEKCARFVRYHAELQAYQQALERRLARYEAKPLQPARAPAPPPLACLAVAWPPAAVSTMPAASAVRTAAAEATAAAAVAFASGALGHEVAAEAAHVAAATQPAAALVSAGEEWLRAGAAWRKAFESLEAAQHAHPGGAGALGGAAAEVEAAQRFKRELRGACSRTAEDLSSQ